MNFLIVGRRSTEQDDPAGGGGAFQQQAGERDGAENRLARASCVQNRYLSTKTGSGRIQVKQGVFCSGPSRELATQTRTFGPSPAGARAGFRRFCTTRQTSSRGETVGKKRKEAFLFLFFAMPFYYSYNVLKKPNICQDRLGVTTGNYPLGRNSRVEKDTFVQATARSSTM
jgi:hypothetical protein